MFTYAKLLAIGIGIGIFRYLQRKCTKSKMILRVRYPAIFFCQTNITLCSLRKQHSIRSPFVKAVYHGIETISHILVLKHGIFFRH